MQSLSKEPNFGVTECLEREPLKSRWMQKRNRLIKSISEQWEHKKRTVSWRIAKIFGGVGGNV